MAQCNPMSDEIGFRLVSLVPTLQQSAAPIESDPGRIAEHIVDKLREAGFDWLLLSMDGQETDEASQLSWLDIQRHHAYLNRLKDGLAKTHRVPESATVACTVSNSLLRKIDRVELSQLPQQAKERPMAEDSATSLPVDVHDLARRFGALVGVDHLSPAVPKGEIFGLIDSGWCRQEHVHQDVDTQLLFDLGYPFPG